jgi:RimJ/RimL family protein N-acetyltransferase
MEAVQLTTARAVLSTPVAADAAEIFAACQDADIQRYTTVPVPYLREHADGFVEQCAKHWADGVTATWAIRVDGHVAGMIDLHGLPGGGPEIGYWMTREFRGRGLLTEAASAVVDFGFGELGAVRIEWRAVVGNIGSARTARRLGFRFEGTLRQALANSLGRDDAWIAGLLATDDRAPRPWPVLD